jgi:hypothetical protein
LKRHKMSEDHTHHIITYNDSDGHPRQHTTQNEQVAEGLYAEHPDASYIRLTVEDDLGYEPTPAEARAKLDELVRDGEISQEMADSDWNERFAQDEAEA